MSSQEQTLTRWRTFIQKVTGRLRDVLAEAEHGCADMVASNGADPLPLGNVLMALRARKQNLDKKINDTWSEQVSSELADDVEEHAELKGAVTLSGKALDQAEIEMKAALAWMDETFETFRVRWSAQSVRAMWPHVQASMQKPVSCQQCGRPVQPTVRHQAESVTCPACRSVNQVSPEPVVYTYFSMAPHAFAEEATFGKRMAVERYRREVEAWRSAEASRTGNWPDEGIDSLRRWEAMERDYWTSYAAAQAQVGPMTPQDQQKLVEARMKPFIEFTLETNDVWRRAHGLPTRG